MQHFFYLRCVEQESYCSFYLPQLSSVFLVLASTRSVWHELWHSVDTIIGPDILLNLDVTCLFKAQYKPKGPGMQLRLHAITVQGQKISSTASCGTPGGRSGWLKHTCTPSQVGHITQVQDVSTTTCNIHWVTCSAGSFCFIILKGTRLQRGGEKIMKK